MVQKRNREYDAMTFPLSPVITKTSPWGPVESMESVGDTGIVFVTTASHGGYYVPPVWNAEISKKGRDHGYEWTKQQGWYEEDCSAAYVVRDLPEFFTPELVKRATELIKSLDSHRR